jgi:hypothetical protein
VEPIVVLVIDQLNQPLTGKTNIMLSVRRQSDAKYLDWDDMHFKNGMGGPTQLYQPLAEVHATRSAGEYQYPFDTSDIINPIADDIYEVRVEQVGDNDAVNLPQIGELKVDGWLEKPEQVRDELRNFGLDHLVSVNPGIVPPAAGTYIRQILDKEDRLLVGGDVCVVKQSYAYDPILERITGQVWLEKNNGVVVTAVSVSVSWFNADGDLKFTMTDSAPDAQGFFKVEQAAPGLVRNRSYYAVATVAMPGLGNVISGKGALTIG